MARMMKGVDDFLYVLAIALGLIVILSAVAVFMPSTPGGSGGNQTVADFTLGTIGYSEDEPRSSSLGTFTVGETQQESLRDVPQLEISASLFSASREELNIMVPDYLMDSMRDVLVTFRVHETNQYGNLRIKWNGMEVYSDNPPRGEVSFKIQPNYVRESNSMEIECDGPGFAFWASNVYTLREFDVSLEYGPARHIAFTMMPGEIETLSRGELSFIGFGDSDLRVKINGYKLWEKTPDGVETVVFNYTGAPLKTGDNIITLECPGGEVTLNNAKLDLYVLTNQVTRSRTFELTESQYDLLDNQGYTGEVRYDVDAVNRPGRLDVSLNDEDLEVTLPFRGWNSVPFTTDEAQEGLNTLEFSGTGYWDIGEVRIVLVR